MNTQLQYKWNIQLSDDELMQSFGCLAIIYNWLIHLIVCILSD